LAAAQALNFNVGDLDRVVQGFQFSQEPIARFDKPPLSAQLK
jgi:hypothetical protein